MYTVTVYSVNEGSYAQKAGILPGDIIISVCGEEVNDVLDYRFYITGEKITLLIHRGEDLFDVVIEKDEYDDIGLEFSTYLMDEKRTCRNKCMFCFIDQMPKGCRETLYFKDDDSRLSFLQGNYITCTNLTDRDIDRIVKMHMSPVNISVHTTNPELRVKMMKNKNAGKILDIMRRFKDGGITMNGQIVLCKNTNDKDELERSMCELEQLYPALSSVSVVPCGLTDHRQGLPKIEPFTKEDALYVIKQIDEMGEKCLKKHGSRIFFASDEFYITAGLPLPCEEHYEGYPQLENGVGMITSLMTEFEYELEYISEYDLEKTRRVSVATGKAAYPYIKKCCDEIMAKVPNTHVTVYCIENNFFGKKITVAGLLTGADITSQLQNKPLGDVLLIPSVSLRHEGDMFLDSMTLDEAEKILNVSICPVISDGAELIKGILY